MKDSLDSSQVKKAIQVLETACRIRDRERLLLEIPALLAGVRDSRYVRLRALDWYWRAGLHFEGVRTALADPAGGGQIGR